MWVRVYGVGALCACHLHRPHACARTAARNSHSVLRRVSAHVYRIGDRAGARVRALGRAHHTVVRGRIVRGSPCAHTAAASGSVPRFCARTATFGVCTVRCDRNHFSFCRHFERHSSFSWSARVSKDTHTYTNTRIHTHIRARTHDARVTFLGTLPPAQYSVINHRRKLYSVVCDCLCVCVCIPMCASVQ